MKLALKSTRVINPNEMIGRKYVLVNGKKIAGITNTAPVGYHVIDLKDNYLSPGFIDIHTHGGGGASSTEGTAVALETIAKTHARFGTTSLVLAVSAAPFNVIERIGDALLQRTGDYHGGSSILGMYLEGPFMHYKKRGATPKSYLRKPDNNKIRAIFHSAAGQLKIISIAPELHNSLDAIKFYTENNIICAIGHSNASYEETKFGIDHGIRLATHLFNAMSPMHHRNPGIAGAVLENKDIPVELICDGIHLHPAIVKITYAVKGINKIILITDALFAMGTHIKKFVYLRQPVRVINNRPTMLSGTIAGSNLTLNNAVYNFSIWNDIPIQKAIQTVTTNPAKLLKLEGTKGKIMVGLDADLVAFDDELTVNLTVAGGTIAYKHPKIKL